MTVIEKHKKIRFKRWELRKAILEIIFLSLISGGGSPSRPLLPLIITNIIQLLKEDKKLSIEERKVRRVLDNLERSNILSLVEQNGTVYVQKLNDSHPTVAKYSLQFLIDFKKQKKQWDGKWYAVFFDVPELQRNKRDYVRVFLKKLGFYPYQKSVYLLPFECEQEVAMIKKIVEGANYMKYAIIDQIEDEERLKEFFSLSD